MLITRRQFVSSSMLAGTYCCSGRLGLAQQDSALADLPVCTELVLSDVELASWFATAENPKNQPVDPSADRAEALSLFQKKWNPERRLIDVDFLVQPAYTDKVIRFAKIWEEYMGLRFRFGVGEPEILIAFDPGGSWSFIETDSIYFAKNGRPSMNFGWFHGATDDEEFRRTTLHEFGHALSLVHEHQHPGGQIDWNREAVYQYYRQQGWDQTMVDRNIFQKYELSQINGSSYDRASIMHYPIPRPLVLEAGDAVGWNTELSENDKLVIAFHYPTMKSNLPGGT